ncbi:MAG: conjugal transfer protein [Lachnospiraceae bacterium]|nr:conjugal transfer protein [Lachnospiraceae bacterium]
MDERKIKRYSVQLAMLKKLLLLELISSAEYKRILKKLMKDYGIISNINT